MRTRTSGIGESGRPVLITGGAGFIGANVAHRLAERGVPVVVFDNLSRASVEHNLRWLRARHGTRVRFERSDIRDVAAVRRAVAACERVFHFAAQVAVTTSLVSPVEDFEINARGTLNVLDAIRAQREPPPLLYTSTNKVYGALGDVTLEERDARWVPPGDLAARGVSEARPLDFHSPYGCSKGAADQYVIDFARSYRLPATVFRMSCIYGPRQFGNEDQGWVAHFLRQAIARRPITLYGDGKQVRDVLYIDDLMDAMLLAHERIDEVAGEAFNIGGGPMNTVSLVELLGRIEQLVGHRPGIEWDEWRTGDQRWYVSDTRRFSARTGWRARVDVAAGLSRLLRWIRSSEGAQQQAMSLSSVGSEGSGSEGPERPVGADAPSLAGATEAAV